MVVSEPNATERCVSPRSERLRGSAHAEPGHAAGGDDALLRVGLVVLLDVVEIVAVVDHQAVRLLQGALGRVAEPVEPFQPRAVAEMEARDRVDRQAAAVARAQEIPGGGAHQRVRDRLGDVRIAPPIRGVERGKRVAILLVRARATPRWRARA